MLISSLAPWFGAKRTLSPIINDAIGEHVAYWEPFCGSMAVLLGKRRCQAETVNDMHGDIVNLSRCVQDPMIGPMLYRKLRRVLASEELFREAKEALGPGDFDCPVEAIDVKRAYYYFIMSWQGMNGLSGTKQASVNYAKRYSSKGGSGGTRWMSAVNSIPQWRRRLEGVQILRSDGIGLCEKIEDREGTVIYVDPPYLVKGAKYLHDFTPEQHERLAAALHRYKKTRVIVSYYDHPQLEALYPSFRTISVAITKSLVNAGHRQSSDEPATAPEVLLANFPFPVRSRLGDLFDFDKDHS